MTVPYEPGKPTGWEAGLQVLQIEVAPTGRRSVRGPCPRCTPHEIVQDVVTQSGTAIAPAPLPTRVLLVCNCGFHHDGAPQGTRGCGATGAVSLLGDRVGAAAVSDEERAANAWAIEALKERLPRIRAAAEKWGTTVSALTALLGTGTVVQADDVVRSLTTGAALWYGVFVLLALLAAAGSILYAAWAAQESDKSIAPGLEERLTLYDDQWKDAIENLRVSRMLAGVAAVCLIISFGIRWYAPEQPPPPTTGAVSMIQEGGGSEASRPEGDI